MAYKEIRAGLTQLDVRVEKEGFHNFLSMWLIRDEKRKQTILVETGPAAAVPGLVGDLERLGADKIDYLLYTHIHIDHSGGAGHFHERYPDTKIMVPAGGQAHLIAPERLYEASIASLGASLIGSYGKPVPLPGSAFTEQAPPGLTVINTPGHAPFHNSYLYDLDGARILFPGEAAGFFCKLIDGSVYQRPATPHKFFYDTAMASLDTLLELGPVDLICYPHYGCAVGEDAKAALGNAKGQLELWKKVISRFTADTPEDEIIAALCEEDALVPGVNALPLADMEREMYFIRQSINGFKGYLFR